MTADESTSDSLIEAAIEVLIDRTVQSAGAVVHVEAWRTKARSNLHKLHDARAFELVQQRPGLTPRGLADALGSGPLRRTQVDEPAMRTAYERAEQQRRSRFAEMPPEALDEPSFRRCLAEARAALAEAGQ
jgi:hypothetical protein